MIDQKKRPIPYDAVPPHDLMVERSVLGSMLIDRTALEYVMDMLTTEDFYLGRHRFLFVKIVATFRIRHAMDEEILVANMKAMELEKIGKDYIGKIITGTTSAANIEGYCSTLANLHHERKRLKFALRIVHEITKKPEANTAREPNPTARAGTGAEGVATK